MDQKLEHAIKLSGIPHDAALRYIDADWTFWRDRGDCDRAEHETYLQNSDANEIGTWLRSVHRDVPANGMAEA